MIKQYYINNNIHDNINVSQVIMSARDLLPYIYSNNNQHNISPEKKKLKKELNKGKITTLYSTKITLQYKKNFKFLYFCIGYII